jgi:uncharacterized protein (TIRG00374 family)
VRWSKRGAIGVAVSVASLAWIATQVSFGDVWAVFRTSNWEWWILAVVTATSIFLLRAIRWRVILDPVAGPLPIAILWRAVAVGMMVTNVIPLRVGEIARAYALTRETSRVGFAASFTSVAVDRVFDTAVLLVLLVVGMLDLPAGAGEREFLGQTLQRWVASGAIMVAFAIAALYVVVAFPRRIIQLFEAFARRVAPAIEARGRALLLAFADGLSVLRSPRRFALVLGWTIAHWLVNALAIWLGFHAVALDLPFSTALVLQTLIGVAVAAPSSPGFWGLFEFAAVLVLTSVYGIDPAAASAWAIGYHLLTFVPITLIGLFYFGRLDMRFGELGQVGKAGADT